MNKLLKYTLFILCMGVMQSCVKDMQDDLNDGGILNSRTRWDRLKLNALMIQPGKLP